MTQKSSLPRVPSEAPHPNQWEVLHKAAGCDIVNADMSLEMTEERLIDLLKGAAAAIVGVVPMTAHVLAHAPDLKVVSVHGVGVDHIDLDAAARLGHYHRQLPRCQCGVSVRFDDRPHDCACPEHFPALIEQLRQGGWGRHQGSELFQKTLGIIGLGHIGLGVAKRAMGFDMKVLVTIPLCIAAQRNCRKSSLASLDEIFPAG